MLEDIIKKDLKVIFCGINPGLKSSLVGQHFSGKSNRFWKVLHQAGFTPQEISPANAVAILDLGYGLTTAVARATTRADELSKEEFDRAAALFRNKMKTFKPTYIAFLGKAAYLAFSGKKELSWGLQPDAFCGAKVWILPNPSGLNRGFGLADLITHYQELLNVLKQSGS